MSNVGVFGWIREGVRRAVLLGFSDAVEQVGAPDEKDSLHPQLQSLLRESPRRLAAEMPPIEAVPTRQQRKRLGRSLGQIQKPGGTSAQ